MFVHRASFLISECKIKHKKTPQNFWSDLVKSTYFEASFTEFFG